MTQEHLAMAWVPVQQWGLLYREEEALGIGTIFQDLNKPFFAAEDGLQGAASAFGDQEISAPVKNQQTGGQFPGENSAPREREALLRKIQQVSFVLDDLRLYLDTHPEDKKGLSLFKAAGERRKALMKEYARQFYPLTADCMVETCWDDPGAACFCWQKGPAPWEGGCV